MYLCWLDGHLDFIEQPNSATNQPLWLRCRALFSVEDACYMKKEELRFYGRDPQFVIVDISPTGLFLCGLPFSRVEFQLPHWQEPSTTSHVQKKSYPYKAAIYQSTDVWCNFTLMDKFD